ncbi:MAG: hypothetical protein ACRERU_14725 [Methylococcales bacterium]
MNSLNPTHERKADDGQWRIEDALMLRRYRPPQREDRRDVWTVADEPEINSGTFYETKPSNRDLPGGVSGPAIECNIGDRVVVHFRNNDRRNRVMTKMLEVNLPFGGPITLPTPFQEPVPLEVRTHSLRPYRIDRSSIETGTAPWFLPGPMQPVGSEALLWSEIGVTAFKKGDRVPPGRHLHLYLGNPGLASKVGISHDQTRSIRDRKKK